IAHTTLDQRIQSWTKFRLKDRPRAPFFQQLKALGSRTLQNRTYFSVRGDEIFQFVVGKFRLYEFLTRDDTYYQNLKALSEGHEVYFLLDTKMLHALLDLLQALENKGLPTDAIGIRYAYRSPEMNKLLKGGKGSRHKYGEAVDLEIGDLNGDGTANNVDKQIVIELLDKKIIGNRGGIGRYPKSQIVHFDTRGHRARWDKQGSFDF
ncbi:MAG: DUF882 domain-containing protein, partial [Bacteroidota bacterium]